MDKVSNIEDASEDDYPRLVNIAKELKINLVVPGPDVPIVGGIEGYFRAGMNFPMTHKINMLLLLPLLNFDISLSRNRN